MRQNPFYNGGKHLMRLITLLFVLWGMAFIYRSSFIAINGNRYFCLFDDAMISMRYAWNFSHGLGLVWNQGEYVEGYTNLLMTLVMSVATLLPDKSAAVFAIQFLGIGLMLESARVTGQVAEHVFPSLPIRQRSLAKVLSFVCVLSYYPLAFWSLMGMETGLLTFLLLLSLHFAMKYTKKQSFSQLLLMAACFGLAFLTRPDSAIFAVITFIFVLLETRESRPLRIVLGHALGAVGVYALFIVGQTAFRYLYYGEFVPNTYILKVVGMPALERIKNGIGFAKLFVKESAIILLVVCLDICFNFNKRKLFLVSFVFVAVAYQIWNGGDPWDYWRIMAPSMPLIFVLFVHGVISIVVSFSCSTIYRGYVRNPIFAGRYGAEVLAVFLIIGGLLSGNARFLPEISLTRKPYQTSANKRNINAAIAIDQLTTADSTVGVFWAGSIPYYTGRRSVDFLGKSDKYIAQLSPDISGRVSWGRMGSVPGHNKYDLEYSIKTLQPTYVQDFSWGTQDLSDWAKSHYVEIHYQGVSLFLLKNSNAVRWQVVSIPQN